MSDQVAYHRFQPDPECIDYCKCGAHHASIEHREVRRLGECDCPAYCEHFQAQEEAIQRMREVVERPLLAEIDRLKLDLHYAMNTTMIQNLNAEIVRLRLELLAAHERHAPECQHMQISGGKRCVDGRDRHYCDRHDSHSGLHRCKCGEKWQS